MCILPVHVASILGRIVPKRLVYKDCYFVGQKFKNVNTTWVAESGIKCQKSINQSRMPTLTYTARYLRNKSWKPECVGSFNMDWWILVFYPEPEAGDKIY